MTLRRPLAWLSWRWTRRSTHVASWSYRSVQAQQSAFLEGQAFLGYPTLTLMAQRAEYATPLATITDDMTRKWIDLKAQAEDEGDDKQDKIDALTDKLEALDVRGAFKTAINASLEAGRGHIYLDTGDTLNRKELMSDLGYGARSAASAFKMGGKKLVGVRPVEAQWCSPQGYETTDPLSPDWYKPRTWHVMGKELHASRLLTLIPFPVGDLLKPAYFFGGRSLVQMAKPYVDNWLQTRQSVSDLIKAFTIFVLHTNLSNTLAGGMDESVDDRIALFNKHRNNGGAFVVDKDSEDFGNVSAPLGSIDHLQAQAQEHMAAVYRIPLVKFLGISPTGLNASSEGELRVYYDLIKSTQEFLLRAPLQIVLDLLQIELFGDVDDAITFDFFPLYELTEAEQSQMRAADADTDTKLIQQGVISAEESRKRIADDPNTPYVDLDPMKVPPPPQQPGEGETVDGAGNKSPGAWAKAFAGVRQEDDSAAWGNAFEKLAKPPGGLSKLRGMAGTAQTMLPVGPGVGARPGAAGQAKGVGGSSRPPFGSTDGTLAFDDGPPDEPRDSKTGEWINAYHGTPHDVPKFASSAIGSGEGAQAYGYGLYFAENQDVARSYRGQLAGSRVMLNGKEFARSGPVGIANIGTCRSARRHIGWPRGIVRRR